jgi:hypothetical protein
MSQESRRKVRRKSAKKSEEVWRLAAKKVGGGKKNFH